jgi:hypothetical protein
MNSCKGTLSTSFLLVALFSCPAHAQTQPAAASRFVLDLGVGIDVSVNGNVNSGAIGRLQGQAAAILPNPYGEVYGTGLHFTFGGGYVLNADTELRGVFTYQSADADLVRLGDVGPSSLYGQYSDYKTLGLDLGYRRYVPLQNSKLRIYGEATIGAAFIDSINVVLSAPQANLVIDQTDFYDSTAAFTWGINFGVLFPVSEKLDFNTQFGLRHVSGLSEVDQFIGTGLDDINNDSARLTFPIVVGVRLRF